MSGWIKLHRRLLEWEWYSDLKVSRLFIHCLLLANYEDSKWRGIDIKKGSFISSLGNLSQSSGLTIREVRTALTKLKSTGELTSKGHAEYSVFTVVKYEDYQSIDTLKDKPETSKRQAKDKQATTDKEEEEYKEGKEIKNIIPPFDSFLAYAVEKKPLVDTQALKLKYDTWVELGWKTGKDNEIKNWKVTLLHTLPYIADRKKEVSEMTDEERKRKANASVL